MLKQFLNACVIGGAMLVMYYSGYKTRHQEAMKEVFEWCDGKLVEDKEVQEDEA